MNGELKRLLADKNYGFIKAEDGKDFFFHKDDFLGFWDDLVTDFNEHKSIHLEFIDEGKTIRGPRARNVSRLDYPNQAAREIQ